MSIKKAGLWPRLDIFMTSLLELEFDASGHYIVVVISCVYVGFGQD